MSDGAEAEPGFDFKPVAGHGAVSLRQGVIFDCPTWLLAKIRGARGDAEATPGLAGLWGPGAAAQGEETMTAGGDFPRGQGSSGAAKGCETQRGMVEHPGMTARQLGATSGHPG